MIDYLLGFSYRQYLRILLAIWVVFLTGGAALFWVNSSLVEKSNISQTQQHLAVLAKVGALSMEDVFSVYRANLLLLANEPEFTNLTLSEMRQDMNAMVEFSTLPITPQMGLLSADGMVLIIASKGNIRTGEGESRADRNYYLWAKTAKKGEVFLSEPMISKYGINKGLWVINMSTPIVSSAGDLRGVLFSSIRIDDLRTNYLGRLKVESPIAVYVIDKNANAVSSPFTSLIGLNVRDYAKEKKWSGYESYLAMVEKMTKSQEGGEVYVFMGSDNKVVRWINAFAPVKVDGGLMSVAVAIPYNQSLVLLGDYFRNKTFWLIFLALVTLVAAFSWIAGLYIAKREGYKEGIRSKFTRKI